MRFPTVSMDFQFFLQCCMRSLQFEANILDRTIKNITSFKRANSHE